jgi:hypothetical protein
VSFVTFRSRLAPSVITARATLKRRLLRTAPRFALQYAASKLRG